MKHLRHLNKYFVKYKWLLLLGILFIAATNFFKVLMPQTFGAIADLIENQMKAATSKDPDAVFYEGLSLFGIFLGYALINTFFLFLTRQTIIVMSRLIEYDLKNEIYDKYQKLSYSFYKVNSTGDVMNRISEDVNHTRMYLGPAVMYTINVFFLFLFVIYFMIEKNAELTLYVLAPLPVMSYIIFKVSSRINKKSEAVQKKQSALSTFVQETFSGIRVLKAFGREQHFDQEFDTEAENYKRASLSLAWTNSLFIPTIVGLIGLSTIITIYVGGTKVIGGTLDIGDITEFMIYVNFLTWPFASIGWVSSLIQRAAASQKRINEFLHTEIEVQEVEHPVDEPIRSITFDNVSFTYPNTGIQALNGISFTIKQGQTLAITGRTGSGKSTCAALLERLFDVSDGRVMINGHDIKDMSIEGYRKRIGYVPQEVFLFSDTIRNNIAFGLDHDVDDDVIIKAATDAHIHHNIEQFENGYDTKVGERGITLSGGQKQRVSIARAIIRKPEVLIFDDCLSAVDTETEEVILGNLQSIMHGRINVIIGHRISSLMKADKIIVLDEGRVVEEGDHYSLMELNGWYAETYQQQLIEEE
ncbi:ABC transporter ATP-binding protein [Parvicella tangerina]|uniref:Multidrug resistance ABC transporter ATP-binding/permease protein YheI n=1 Tax=Parvicella tangerina TaxID=2829795 RepID=A0A916JLT0_9FLAO|nr:ABC transporter ATP-binding protein [Parvicella tangerina]CAG5080803.1 putative multidrug resistance ABC transporter ATP-binding/permease protein YheI [Parvicella tangerina]